MDNNERSYIGTEADNMQKYWNYKIQMGRLNKAVSNEFYLEAIFIEYAVLEDRIESVLRHSGTFRPDKHITLNSKLRRLKEMQRNKKGLLRKYISDELIANIDSWKETRNQLIHAMMKRSLTKEELSVAAMQGRGIIKSLNAKSSSYKRALDKMNGEAQKS